MWPYSTLLPPFAITLSLALLLMTLLDYPLPVMRLSLFFLLIICLSCPVRFLLLLLLLLLLLILFFLILLLTLTLKLFIVALNLLSDLDTLIPLNYFPVFSIRCSFTHFSSQTVIILCILSLETVDNNFPLRKNACLNLLLCHESVPYFQTIFEGVLYNLSGKLIELLFRNELFLVIQEGNQSKHCILRVLIRLIIIGITTTNSTTSHTNFLIKIIFISK